VKDTGIGIKKEDLNKLFRFFGCIAKSKNINRGGMGLGLTISKMIIQQLDGAINVESLPNQGSNFTFRIPITEYFYEAEGASPNVSQLLIQHEQAAEEPVRQRQTLTIPRNSPFIPLLMEETFVESFNMKTTVLESFQEEERKGSSLASKLNNLMLSPKPAFSQMVMKNLAPPNTLERNSTSQTLKEGESLAETVRILIVDDSTYNLFVMKEILT